MRIFQDCKVLRKLSPKSPADTIYDKALSPGKRPQLPSWSLPYLSVFPCLPTLHYIYSLFPPFHFTGNDILPHHLLNHKPPVFYSINLCVHDHLQRLVIIIWPSNKDKGFFFWAKFRLSVQRRAGHYGAWWIFCPHSHPHTMVFKAVCVLSICWMNTFLSW